MVLLKEQERICLELGDKDNLQSSLGKKCLGTRDSPKWMTRSLGYPALRRIIFLRNFVLLRVGLVHVKKETYAAIGLVAKIALLKMQVAQFGSAVATLSN
jgi:hypothetical protein